MGLSFQATNLRNDGYIALARLLQLILAIVVIGIVGSGFPSWNEANSIGCSIPSSMNYMVACGVLTLLYIVYLAISTWPSGTKFLWHPYVQLGLDGPFLIFWIAVCAVAQPTCTQFMNACNNWMSTYYGRINWSNLALGCDEFGECACAPYTSSSGTVKRRMTSAASKAESTGVKIATKVADRQGVGAALVLLFAFSLGFGIYRFMQDKRSGQASSNRGQHEPLSSEYKSTGPEDG